MGSCDRFCVIMNESDRESGLLLIRSYYKSLIDSNVVIDIRCVLRPERSCIVVATLMQFIVLYLYSSSTLCF